jgi:hypothetical protein
VHVGADLDADCVQASKQYDDDSRPHKERQRSGERIDWKARGPPQGALFVVIIKRAIGQPAPEGRAAAEPPGAPAQAVPP